MFWQLETERLLNEKEVAELFSIKVVTLRRWRWLGTGPRFLKIGGAVRYDPQVLKNYLSDRARTSTSDPGGGQVCSREPQHIEQRHRGSFIERALAGDFDPCT